MMKHDDILNMKTWQQCEINALVNRAIRAVGENLSLHTGSSKESGQEAPSRKNL
ncbi:MAG: hypothetical protein ACOYJA_04395 [Christensenellales bacterium]